MNNSDKIKILLKLESENELRTELVMPLMRKNSHFSEVLDNQGSDEAGVDVICVSTSPFKHAEYTAIVLKKGNITLAAADRTNNLINVIETQIRQAIVQPLTHPGLPHDRCFATRIIVMTNGTISKQAEAALRKTYHHNRDLNIDFVAQNALISLIDESWPEFYEDRRPFLSTYAKKLFDSLNEVNLELLGYSKAKKSLSDIYIDTMLFEQANISNAEFLIHKDAVLGQDLCKQPHQLIVVSSGPGGGKSTLLKEIAISQSQKEGDCVAVYMHAREILDAPDVLAAAVAALVRLAGDKADSVRPEIQEEKLLLLVDGLDELADVPSREAVVETLKKANRERNTRVIIGSRPESNPRVLASLADFASYSISPMRYGQIRNFFGKWFKGSDKASKLMEALRDKGVIEKLPRTPMTMTLVAIVFESKEDLPATLTELYEMFVELLTGKWDANRQISSVFDSTMKVTFLSFLAAAMHKERLEVIGQDRAVALANDFFRSHATLEGVDARDFIQSIIDRSHIVVPCELGQIKFSHMSFQEYFAAEYFNSKSIDMDTIISWYGDDWWKEVLFFYAGKRRDISPLIDGLIRSDHSSVDTRLSKLVTLGAMLQAGTLTELSRKLEAIDFASRNFILGYDDIVSSIDGLVSGKVRHKYSRVLILDWIQQLFASNYTSKFLKGPLSAVYESQSRHEDTMSSRFFLACSLERLGDKDHILDFASDPKMVDTSMYLICNAIISEASVLSDTEKFKFKKLKKRREDFRKSIRREFRSVLKLD